MGIVLSSVPWIIKTGQSTFCMILRELKCPERHRRMQEIGGKGTSLIAVYGDTNIQAAGVHFSAAE